MTLSDRFFLDLAALGTRRGSDPAIFLTVWCVESGLNPHAINSIGARGLNQMLPSTLVALGAPTAFEQLSAEAQLPWIERLIASGEHRNGGPFESAARYYHANFFPVTMARGNTPDTIVTARDASDPRESQAYAFNQALDADGDGKITLSDLAAVLERVHPKFDAAFARLESAVARLPESRWQPRRSSRRHRRPLRQWAQFSSPASSQSCSRVTRGCTHEVHERRSHPPAFRHAE